MAVPHARVRPPPRVSQKNRVKPAETPERRRAPSPGVKALRCRDPGATAFNTRSRTHRKRPATARSTWCVPGTWPRVISQGAPWEGTVAGRWSVPMRRGVSMHRHRRRQQQMRCTGKGPCHVASETARRRRNCHRRVRMRTRPGAGAVVDDMAVTSRRRVAIPALLSGIPCRGAAVRRRRRMFCGPFQRQGTSAGRGRASTPACTRRQGVATGLLTSLSVAHALGARALSLVRGGSSANRQALTCGRCSLRTCRWPRITCLAPGCQMGQVRQQDWLTR